jgi:hypothetical protein
VLGILNAYRDEIISVQNHGPHRSLPFRITEQGGGELEASC